MPLTWAQKYAKAKPAHVVVLETPFAGVMPGARLLVLCPSLVERFVREIPEGQAITIPELRARMARAENADAACPVTTSIGLRIVAELALERLAAGASTESVTPFWRAVDPESPLAKRLSCGATFITTQRHLEARAAAA